MNYKEEASMFAALAVNELCDDFERKVNDPKGSDVTIVVASGKTIHAHKLPLFAQSPVFREKYKIGSAEYHTHSVIDLTEFEYDVVMELMRYIYAARIRNIEDKCEQLYVLGKMYELDGLMNWCVSSICEIMGVKNAFDYLKFAKLHEDVGLENATKNYIVANEKLLFREPAFFNLDEEVKNELINLAKKNGLDRPATDEEVKAMIRAWMTAHGI